MQTETTEAVACAVITADSPFVAVWPGRLAPLKSRWPVPLIDELGAPAREAYVVDAAGLREDAAEKLWALVTDTMERAHFLALREVFLPAAHVETIV